MKPSSRTMFLVLLSVGSLVGAVSTRIWVSPPTSHTSAKPAAIDQQRLVDEQPLRTAQRMVTFALTLEEEEFAQEILRLADHELDLTFSSALRAVTLHPASPTPTAREILRHIQEIQTQVKLEQENIAHLKMLLLKAEEGRKQALEQALQFEEAFLEVAQEELDAAQQELIRAGGDPKSTLQRLMEQHDAWHQLQSTSAVSTPSDNPLRWAEQTNPRSALSQFRAWRQLDAKLRELVRAQQELKSREAELARKHQELARLAKGEQPGTGEPSQPAASTPQAENATVGSRASSSGVISILNRVANQQQDLAELDKRIGDLQQLQNLYASWGALVEAQKRGYAIGLIESALWIFVVVSLVLLADPTFRFVFSRAAPGSKRVRTVRTVARFAAQATGVAVILLVIFGPPNQLATVVALAGAGLTVALKDFIVGFFGWFVLMGRNGIRPGDWVEIEGIEGEVLEIGLLHTILLETGNWSDSGHPTGRKVTFVNSFAIERHYFNFSTSGQWLWDEIQVPIPPEADPYPIADAVQKVIAAETQANVRLAEQEWQRVVPSDLGRTFSAAPTITVRPTNLGANIIVRYITRATERHEVRTRLYHHIVEILRAGHVPSSSERSTA